jgi:hypothetical protein
MSSRGGFGDGRGRFGRGRGGSGQQTCWRGTPTSATTSQPLPTPLGPIVDTINVKSLLVEDSVPTIEDVTFISSYNWLDSKSPVILVPGKRTSVYLSLTHMAEPYLYPTNGVVP